MPSRLLPHLRLIATASLLGALCGCPPAVQPAQPCNASRDCPDHQACRDGLCRPITRTPDAGSLDAAATADAALVDSAGAPDGRSGDAAAGDGATLNAPVVDGAPTDLGYPEAAVDAPAADAGACARAGCPWYTNCVEQTDGGATCLCNWQLCADGEQCVLPQGGLTGGPRCCAATEHNCDGVCVDVRVAAAHCGSCDHRCAWGESCVDGECRCGTSTCDPSRQDCCSGACREVLTDTLHCGPLDTGLGCTSMCTGGSACVEGRCACSGPDQCGDAVTCCDDAFCANLTQDPRNCGECHLACRAGEACADSVCACTSTCDDGLACSEDLCVDRRCAHSTLDDDDDGYCHASCPDVQSGDSVGECVDGDCDDTRSTVHPGASELCDGLDNDCTAATMDGAGACPGRCCGSPPTCHDCCAAVDCGAGSWLCSSDFTCVCESPRVVCDGECRSPNACGGCAVLDEVPGQACGAYACGIWTCDLGRDRVSCLGDHARATYYLDHDLDSYGVDSDNQVLCAAGGEYTAVRGGDCADADVDRNPGRPELCNGLDDNCAAGTTDDGAAVCSGRCCGTPPSCRVCCAAGDCGTGGWECTDGFTCSCSAPLVECAGDCRVANPCGGCSTLGGVPGQRCGSNGCGTWQCAQASDQVECVGDHPASTYHRDDDEDGFGVPGDTLELCAPTAPYTAIRADDCDDSCATCYPGARELCDQLLNDCDLPVADPSTCWWDASWKARVLLRFDRTSRTTVLTDFPLLAVLTAGRIDFARVQPGQTDLRFVDAVTREVLAHEVEQWSASSTAQVWVKVPSVATTPDDHIWLYFDNPLAASPPRLPTEVWSNGYRAVYHLNGTAADSTGQTPPGALHGALPTTGQIGGGLLFSGDDWVDLGHDLNTLTSVPAATLSVWMKAAAFPGAGANLIGWTVSLPYPTQITRAALEIDGPELRILGRTVDATTPFYDSFVPRNLDLNRWYLLTGVLDFAGGHIVAYVDGTQEDTEPANFGPVTPGTLSTCASLGAEEDGSTHFYTGALDEVRASNVVRGLGWVRADNDSQRDLFITYGPITNF